MQNLQSAFVVFLTFSIGVNCVNFENSTENDNETKQRTTDFCYFKCGDDPYMYCEGDQVSYQTTKCVCPIKTEVLDEHSLTCMTRCMKTCGSDSNTVCSGDQTTDETTICGCKDPIHWVYDKESRQCLRCGCDKGEKCAFNDFYNYIECEGCKEGYSTVNGICKGDCSNSPCKNGGHCRIDYDDDIICDCVYPFTGEFCEESVHCDPNPCMNGGTCRGAGDTFECACPDIYGGRTCSENIFCEKYGEEYCGKGSCYVSKNPTKVYCACGDGQYFDEVPRTCVDDPCHPYPCENGGTCVREYSRYPEEKPYTCLCRSTHMGKNCTESTWCIYNRRSVCGNEATCHYDENSEEYSCICASGETFDEELKICRGICKPNPCVHGTCIKDGKYAYHCSCFTSYVGKYCDEEVIYPCTINPCQNGGSCSSFGPYYVCSCNLFHTGKNCERVDLSMIAVVIVPLGVLGIGLVITIILIRRRNQKLKVISQRMEAYRAIQNAMPVSR